MAYPIVKFLFPVPVSSWSLCRPNSVQTIRILRDVTKTVVGILLGLTTLPRGLKKHALAAVQICAGNIGQLLGWFLYSCWEEINWCVMWKTMCVFLVSFVYTVYIYIFVYMICVQICFDFSRIFCTSKMWMIRREDYGTCGQWSANSLTTNKSPSHLPNSWSYSQLLGKNVKNTCLIVVF